MKKAISITLRKHDYTALHCDSLLSASQQLERALRRFVRGEIPVSKDDMETVKTAATIDAATKVKLEEAAKAMGVSVSALTRVIAEKDLALH